MSHKRDTKSEQIDKLKDANQKLRGDNRKLKQDIKRLKKELLYLQNIDPENTEGEKTKPKEETPKCHSCGKVRKDMEVGIFRIYFCEACGWKKREKLNEK